MAKKKEEESDNIFWIAWAFVISFWYMMFDLLTGGGCD